ncbi:response regulator transcription factor [Petropleomorpha daqingensis]|uniref:DNA-binding CsgD family transcriptional regulator n=1 Tax=Petropleomorpha daqingensis TaxID=2026353 RepID=A0A853CF77_9ACTN|nr:helix-turn-helix transcriptional regulator [Petropleomorpha daqingensis]NYJ05826.1 DNA-binding CsgD family transcriptional regulator [Petropleomorpha daqingensis]
MSIGGDQGEGAEPLRVLVVGADPDKRRRLARLLAGVAGVEVVGWLESSEALEVLGYDDDELAIVSAEPALRRPKLSARQRDVLIAYAAGNQLMPAVARSLGMDQETLKTHLRRIRVKYREVGRPAPTRRDLYVRAVEDGLLPPPS